MSPYRGSLRKKRSMLAPLAHTKPEERYEVTVAVLPVFRDLKKVTNVLGIITANSNYVLVNRRHKGLPSPFLKDRPMVSHKKKEKHYPNKIIRYLIIMTIRRKKRTSFSRMSSSQSSCFLDSHVSPKVQ